MSYYREDVDVVFKMCFSSSYVNFSDSDIERKASDILHSAIHEPTSADKFLIRRLVNEGFKNTGRSVGYKAVYTNLLKSTKLIALFESFVNFDYLKSPEIKKAAFNFTENKFFKSEAVRYARYEDIPVEFALLALNDHCLKYLVGFFLKKHLGTKFTSKILRECQELTNKWQSNLELKTPYDRTGEFQSYLHNLSDTVLVDRGEISISTKLMRVLLSTSRLHFSYSDEKNINKSSLNKVLAYQKEAAELESKSGPDDFYKNACLASTTTKKYIKNWRKRHLSPFFRKTEAIETMEYLSNLDSRDKYTKVKLILVNSDIFSVDELKTHFAEAH